MQIVHIEAYVSHILDVIVLSLLRVQLESRMKGKLWPNLNPYTKSLCYRGSDSVNSVGIFLFASFARYVICHSGYKAYEHRDMERHNILLSQNNLKICCSPHVKHACWISFKYLSNLFSCFNINTSKMHIAEYLHEY